MADRPHRDEPGLHHPEQDALARFDEDTMELRLTCPRCGAAMASEGEDELVARVRSHVRDYHGASHVLSRKHILARLRRQRGISK